MREKIRTQASLVNRHPISSSSALNQLYQKVAAKTRIATLAISLGLAGGLWFSTEVHTTQIAQAETVNVGLAIDRRNNETYESLLKRAEALAKATAEESFAQNQDATDVSITVVGRHHGAIAPVLSLKVGRDEWSGSTAKRWITHFGQARSLLRFDEDVADTNSNNQPQTNQRRFRSQPRQSGNSSTTRNRPDPGSSGAFSQPGRAVDSSVPGATNSPSSQPSNTNTTNPLAGQNPATGNTTSQPPATPTASPNQPQNFTPPATGNTTSQPSATSPTSPNQPQNSIPPGGANLTPQPPAAPEPLTPSGSSPTQNQPNNTNSGFPTNSNTTPAGNSQGSTP